MPTPSGIPKIPPITDPMGQHWKQPDRSRIVFTKDCAIMSQQTLGQLADYSASVPTGRYDGKMWKAERTGAGGKSDWVLCWYHGSDPTSMTITLSTLPVAVEPEEIVTALRQAQIEDEAKAAKQAEEAKAVLLAVSWPASTPASTPPPKKEGWDHSERVLVYYAASPEGGVGDAYGIAYYHYKPPFDGPSWVDFHSDRTPDKWWPLPKD